MSGTENFDLVSSAGCQSLRTGHLPPVLSEASTNRTGVMTDGKWLRPKEPFCLLFWGQIRDRVC